MPLKEIKTYIDHRNPEDLTTLLLEQQKKVQQELLHLKRIEQVIQTKLELVTEGTGIRFQNGLSQPFLAEYPEEILITTPYLGTGHHDAILAALSDHIGYVNTNRLNTGHPYGAVMSVEDLRQGNTDQYAYFITKVADLSQLTDLPSDKYMRKSQGLYAVIYLQGDYYLADEAFQDLLHFIDEQRLKAGEFCYKEAVWDELTVQSEQGYITRISIPVST